MADMARLIWAEWADTNPNKTTRFIAGEYFILIPALQKAGIFYKYTVEEY